MIRFAEDANGKAANFHVGEMFEIFLTETRMAGFKWVVEKCGEPVCVLASESTEAASGAHGGSGAHIFQYRAVKAGTATILLRHRRPWESSEAQGHIFQLQIQVTE
jgi:predicted secreted protein